MKRIKTQLQLSPLMAELYFRHDPNALINWYHAQGFREKLTISKTIDLFCSWWNHSKKHENYRHVGIKDEKYEVFESIDWNIFTNRTNFYPDTVGNNLNEFERRRTGRGFEVFNANFEKIGYAESN